MAWLSGYAKRRKVTVQQAYLDSDLTNFPLYVKLADNADVKDALSTGYDVRFTQSDGETLLKYERESWSGGGGGNVTADFWVKVPSLASTGDATEIYLYWGKAGDSDGQDAANVWDAYYGGVWHLNNNAANTVVTESKNGHTSTASTNTSNMSVNAKVARGFDHANQQVTITNHASLTIGSGDCTMTALINPDTIGGFKHGILSSMGGVGYCFAVKDAWGPRLYVEMYDGSNPFGHSDITVSLGSWQHVALVRDTGSGLYRFFINGVARGTVNDTCVTINNATNPRIGYNPNSAHYYDGKLDEIRFAKTARTAAWLKFEYRNIFEADNELTWGSVETPAGAARARVLGGGLL